jgi:hypothetical protein
MKIFIICIPIATCLCVIWGLLWLPIYDVYCSRALKNKRIKIALHIMGGPIWWVTPILPWFSKQVGRIFTWFLVRVIGGEK